MAHIRACLAVYLLATALGHGAESSKNEDRSDTIAMSKNMDVHGSIETEDRDSGHYVWWQPHPITLVTETPLDKSSDSQVDALHYTDEPHHVRSSNVDDDGKKPEARRHLVIGRLEKRKKIKHRFEDRMLGDQPDRTDLDTSLNKDGVTSEEKTKEGTKMEGGTNVNRRGRIGKGGRWKMKRQKKQKRIRTKNRRIGKRKQRNRNRISCGENDVCPVGKCCVENRKGLKFCRKSHIRVEGRKCLANCQCKQGLQCFVRERKRAKAPKRRRGHCFSPDFVDIGPGHFMTNPPSTPPPERA